MKPDETNLQSRFCLKDLSLAPVKEYLLSTSFLAYATLHPVVS